MLQPCAKGAKVRTIGRKQGTGKRESRKEDSKDPAAKGNRHAGSRQPRQENNKTIEKGIERKTKKYRLEVTMVDSENRMQTRSMTDKEKEQKTAPNEKETQSTSQGTGDTQPTTTEGATLTPTDGLDDVDYFL